MSTEVPLIDESDVSGIGSDKFECEVLVLDGGDFISNMLSLPLLVLEDELAGADCSGGS